MAIVKGPALSIDASGNVGGVCFTKWRGLQIAKAAWSGTPTPSQKQTDQKNRMVTAQQAWGGVLNDAERSSWRAAAADQVRISRVKTIYIPSGFNYFLGLTVQLLRQGFAIERMPPTAMEVFLFTYITADQDGTIDRLITRFEGREPDRPDTIQGEDWMAGPYVSGGYHPQVGDYRFQEFRSITGGNYYIDLEYEKYYWFKMRWIDTSGRVGNWFEISTFMTSPI
ncbi:hypothetical protein ES703_84006 [subsurface metagenome]